MKDTARAFGYGAIHDNSYRHSRAGTMAETAEPNKVFTCRVADKNDEPGIWNVLAEVAADIPARVEEPEDQKNLKSFISKWVAGGSSWVAVDSKGAAIGFVLSTPDNAISIS